MLTVYVQEGDTLEYTPGADMALGDVVVQGDLVGVLVRDTKAGELGALTFEGVFEFPKPITGGSAFGSGAKAYWDAVNKKAVNVDGGGANKYIGKAILAVADAVATVRIKLQQ